MNPELQALQAVIQDLHSLMTVLRDPQDTNTAAQCLKALTGIQQKMMQPQPGAQAVMNRLGGASG